jgi:hypothetical protein
MRFHFSDLFGRDRIRLHKERPAEARCGAPQGWPNHNDIGGIVIATNSLSPAERLKSAVFTLALQRAKTAVKRQLQAKGHKVAHYSARDITMMAQAYLDQHRAELIAEAKATVECWVAEGFFGKRVQLAFAKLSSDAQTPSEPKSITSLVQMSGAK